MGKHEKQQKSSPGYLLKINQEQGVVDAIVSVMGVIDDGGDRIMPGAYTKTIQERGARIRPLDLHGTDSIMRVLGKVIEIRELSRDELPEELVSKYPSATGGLFTSTQYLLDTPEGVGAFKRISSGAINEYSIGYEALDFDYEQIETDGRKVRIRNIRTIRLWEYSPVIWGMNEATMTTGIKSEDDNQEVTVGKDDVTDDQKENKNGTKLLGDTLHSLLIMEGTWKLTYCYTNGYLNTEEFNQMMEILTTQMANSRNAIPEDIANIVLSSGDYYYMSNSGQQQEKQTSVPEQDESMAGSPDGEEKDITAPTDGIKELLERANNIG